LEVSTEAAQLFVDRARATRPSINPSRFSAADVQRICGHVDGLPLAIEIAAARLRTMTLREVADQLAQRIGAMTQALQWSVDLLSESERRIFYRLSVFHDGFTVESATAICVSDVSEAIASLADSSLVVPPEPDALYPRYRMLESIRQTAFKALSESGAGEVVQDLHAHHFARYFIALDEDLRHARSSLYFDVLEREYQNVRSALERLIVKQKDVESGMKLALALSRYWFDRGMIAEARSWMERALTCDADPQLAARVFQCLATVSRNCGDYAESYRLVGQGVERLKAGGADARTIGKAVAVQSNAARILGDFETARKLGYEAIALFEPSGDAYLTAFAHTCIATTLYGEGRLREAEREFEHILDEFEKCGAENDSVLTLTNLGICRLYAGDYDVARARFNAALPRAVAMQHRYCEAWTRLGLTIAYALAADYQRAEEELARSAQLAGAIDDKEVQVGCVEAAALCCAQQMPELAAHFLGCAGRARERYHIPRLPVETALYEKLHEDLSARFGVPALAIALEEGRFMSLESSLKRLEARELATVFA
jgi:tetratricopeptide (TPR) repeat protein